MKAGKVMKFIGAVLLNSPAEITSVCREAKEKKKHQKGAKEATGVSEIKLSSTVVAFEVKE